MPVKIPVSTLQKRVTNGGEETQTKGNENKETPTENKETTRPGENSEHKPTQEQTNEQRTESLEKARPNSGHGQVAQHGDMLCLHCLGIFFLKVRVTGSIHQPARLLAKAQEGR